MPGSGRLGSAKTGSGKASSMAANTGDARVVLWERLMALFSSAIELTRSGRRSLEEFVDLLELVNHKPNFMEQAIAPMMQNCLLQEWKRFYSDHEIELDTENIKIPERPSKAWDLIVVPGGRSVNGLLKIARVNPEQVNKDCGRQDSFEKLSADPYALWVLKSPFPDQTNTRPEHVSSGFSARENEGDRALNLQEYLLYSAFVFWQTQDPLDVTSLTLAVCGDATYEAYWSGYGVEIKPFRGSMFGPRFIGSRLASG